MGWRPFGNTRTLPRAREDPSARVPGVGAEWRGQSNTRSMSGSPMKVSSTPSPAAALTHWPMLLVLAIGLALVVAATWFGDRNPGPDGYDGGVPSAQHGRSALPAETGHAVNSDGRLS